MQTNDDYVYDTHGQKYHFADGYTEGNGASYFHYYIRDHQGNNRVGGPRGQVPVTHKWDLVAENSPVPGAKQQNTSNEWSSGHSITDFMQYIQSLPAGKYKVVNGQIVQQ